MNSFEMNKIIGAILGTILLVMGVGFLAEAIYAPIEGRGPGYNLPVPEENSGAGGETTAEPVAIPLAVLLASASPDAGASVARKCQSCHNFDQGAGSKVGPELYGVVGRQVASREGFGYSDALKQLGGEGTVWTYENLNEFLTSPKAFAEGTKMSFAGLRKETDRADILAYLQTLSSTPLAFPVAETATPAATDTAAPTSTPDAPAANDAVSTATDVVNEAADAAANAADGVAQTVTDAVTDIAQTATDTASEAVSTATNTVEAVAETATEATTPAASEATTPAATETTAPAASETATPAATETAQTETSEAPPADVGENAALYALIANGSVEDGARVSRKCQACHSLEEGGRNKVGPVLYNIVGGPVAANETFKYSDAFKALGAEGKVWTFEMLDGFLTKPRDFIDGTKMSFGGLRKEEDRANLIAYLRTLSASPVPLASQDVTDTAPAVDTTVPTDTTAPAATDTTAPAATETTAPAATETTAPAASETATPAATETAQAETSEAPPADAGENAALYALIANGSVEDGARVSRKCQACHSLEEGGRNKVGPVLYNIVGSPVAANETFKYSDAVKALGAEGKVWTFEMLDSWLTKPRDFVPGTKMSFGGLRKEEDRANLIAYLRTLSASPVPLASQ